MANGTLIAAMKIGRAAEDEYDLDSVAVLKTSAYLAIGGDNLSPWSSARRFRGTGNRKYVALYHLDTPDVVESDEWKNARQSDWTSRLQPHFRDHLRLVLRRYVRGG